MFANGNTVSSDGILKQKSDLKCTPGLGSKANPISFSWYKKEPSVENQYTFIFEHKFTKDPKGGIQEMDSFTDYSNGDDLVCCMEIDITSRNCTGNPDIMTTCQSLSVRF